MIDSSLYDPLYMGFLGGLLIGISAAIMLLALGYIAGISGLIARATNIASSITPKLTAAAFIIGLPLGTALISQVHTVTPTISSNTILLATGGLLVGFGTRLGSGCTSGHGVCGLSRLSPRSMAATITFIITGIATVTVMRIAGLT